MKNLASKLKAKADKVNQERVAKEKIDQQERMEKEEAKVEKIRQLTWERFNSDWEKNITNAAEEGKYSCEVYRLTKYDMPKSRFGSWQTPNSNLPTETIFRVISPQITEENITGTAKKVFYFLKNKELNPKLELKVASYEMDKYYGQMNNYVVTITANW